MAMRVPWRRGPLGWHMVAGIAIAISVPVPGATGPFRHQRDEPLNSSVLTPGAWFDVSLARICTARYFAGVRDVPESERRDVYREYGITHRARTRSLERDREPLAGAE